MTTTIKNYAVRISEELSERGYDNEITEVKKNNDVTLTGIVIKGEDSNIHPTIYVNPFYEEGMDIFEAADEVEEAYNNARDSFDIDVNRLGDFDYVKDKLFFAVVNRDSNAKRLEDLVFTDFLDLAIIYKIKVDDHANITVKKDMANLWGVSIEDIDRAARENTPKFFEGYMASMFEMLMGLNATNLLDEDVIDSLQNGDNPMYILTNNIKSNGASVILYENMLKEMSKRFDDDMVVIPSSIHEVIVIPKSKVDDINMITEMIQQVNETEVSLEERLSDHAYIYSRESDELLAA